MEEFWKDGVHANEPPLLEARTLENYDCIVKISRELLSSTWLERAGFEPGSQPEVTDIRGVEQSRIALIVGLGHSGDRIDALVRQIHQAADEAAFLVAHRSPNA